MVIESSGYGRQLLEPPSLDSAIGKSIVSFRIKDRTLYGNPNQMHDMRLVFSEAGTDIDPASNGGWISGKHAVIQSIQMLLGSNRGQWSIDPSFGSYLFRYYRDHHSDHQLLQRLMKLDISRLTSIPDGSSLVSPQPSIPISTVKWVEGARIVGHSNNLLQVELRLYFADDTYFSGQIDVPARIDPNPRST